MLESEPADYNLEIFELDNVAITPHVAFYSDPLLIEVRSRFPPKYRSFFGKNYEHISFIVKP